MDAKSEQFWKHARHLTLNNWKLNKNPRSTSCDSQHQSTGGGSRTPNRRIWNPVLCQLSYTRSIRNDHVTLFLARLFMERVLPKFRTILHQLQPLRPASLLDHSVVPLPGLRAFKPHILTHDKTFLPEPRELPSNQRGQKSKAACQQPSAGSQSSSTLKTTSESLSQHQNQLSCRLRGSRNDFVLPWRSACQAQPQP